MEHAINKTEFDQLHQEFLDRLLIDGVQPPDHDVRLKWSLLSAVMQPYEPGSGATHTLGLKIYFGLDDQHELMLAVAPLIFLPESSTGDLDIFEGRAHELAMSSGQWILVPAENWHGRWRGNEHAFIDRYYDLVQVAREGTTYDDLDRQLDPCACVISWDVMVELYRQNEAHVSDPGSLDLVITHGAREFDDEDGGIAGYRHGVAFHLADGSTDLLDDVVHPGTPYRSKAVDRILPCPTRCGKYPR